MPQIVQQRFNFFPFEDFSEIKSQRFKQRTINPSMKVHRNAILISGIKKFIKRDKRNGFTTDVEHRGSIMYSHEGIIHKDTLKK